MKPEKEKKKKKIFEEIMSPNFPNLLTDIDVYIQEGQQTPIVINTK